MEKVFNFAVSNIFETRVAGRMVADMCRAAVKVRENPLNFTPSLKKKIANDAAFSCVNTVALNIMSSKIGWLHVAVFQEVDSHLIYLAFMLNLGFVD